MALDDLCPLRRLLPSVLEEAGPSPQVLVCAFSVGIGKDKGGHQGSQGREPGCFHFRPGCGQKDPPNVYGARV